MRNWVLLAGVAGMMGALVGCASTSGARYIGGVSSGSASPAAPAGGGAGALTAEDGTDVSACADGNCEIVVTGAVDIPLEPRFGFTTFRVTFTPPNLVEFIGEDAGGGSFRGSVGGTGGIGTNGLALFVRTVRGQGAVVRFSAR
jgi:hypothetical protein